MNVLQLPGFSHWKRMWWCYILDAWFGLDGRNYIEIGRHGFRYQPSYWTIDPTLKILDQGGNVLTTMNTQVDDPKYWPIVDKLEESPIHVVWVEMDALVYSTAQYTALPIVLGLACWAPPMMMIRELRGNSGSYNCCHIYGKSPRKMGWLSQLVVIALAAVSEATPVSRCIFVMWSWKTQTIWFVVTALIRITYLAGCSCILHSSQDLPTGPFFMQCWQLQ